MPDTPHETSAESASAPTEAPVDWEEAARFWERTCRQAWAVRDELARKLEELGRHYDAANNAANRPQQRAHAAEQRLRVAREQGWRAEWNGRERALVSEVLIERGKPGEPWPVVVVDGVRLPWFFRSVSVGDITDDLATVTLVLEAELVVQSNEQPIQQSDDLVRNRAESLIERTHRATAAPTEPTDTAETEAP